MKAAVVSTPGELPKFQEFDEPTVQEGEVLVHVRAAGVHPVVKSIASGAHYSASGSGPMIPGVDGVGTLENGTRVYFGGARKPWGTMAERAAVPRSMHIPLPDGIDDATAAAIANPGMSGWVALKDRAGLIPGETVLILGATGVAGQLAVQIARRKSARRVVAAGRNPRALEELKSLGADAVISLEQEPAALIAAFRAEFAGEGIDIVLDYVWGQPAESALAAIAQKGLSKTAPRVRFVQIGSMAGPSISLSAATLRSSGLEILGSGFGSASLDQIKIAIAEFFKTAATQPFQFSIKTAPLSEVEALWNSPEHGTRLVFQP